MNANKITNKASIQRACQKKKNLNSRCNAFLDQNTLKMSNQILFQNKFGQFREHILPHVFLVMAKSLYTYTVVSKVAKIMCVVCETFVREQEHHYMTSNDIGGSNPITHNHNYLMGTHFCGTSYNSHIS